MRQPSTRAFAASEEPRQASPGFGLGLRRQHYQDFLAEPQPVDWLEIISENYMGLGGKPRDVLTKIRRDYPIAMHGVSLSLGSPGPLNAGYLRALKALAEAIEPLWISDHLAWTGIHGFNSHDLLPLPYNAESLQRMVEHVDAAQTYLGRRLLIENPSSYVAFSASDMEEAAFLAELCQRTDCLLLLDVNNVYVSSVNHGFDARAYIRQLPAERVQQIHVAGHTDRGDVIIDTHDQPVRDEVWALYADTLRHTGDVATMIERDDQIPELPELLRELDRAREISARLTPAAAH